MIDKLVVFDLEGKFACFKKFYTNTSSFTSYVPSRTNLIGIIASIMELSRDSYYDLLNSKNCKIGVEILSDLKKNFHCMNYLKEPVPKKEREYTQVRLEVLSAKNILESNIKFRVYLWFEDNEFFTLNDFIEKIKNKNLGFGVSLGQKQFRGDIKFVDVIKDIKLQENQVKEISTVTNLKNLKSKEDLIYDNFSEIYIEKMPFDFNFIGDEFERNSNILNREISSIEEIVYNKDKNSLLKVNSSFHKVLNIQLLGEEKNISFYEEI